MLYSLHESARSIGNAKFANQSFTHTIVRFESNFPFMEHLNWDLMIATTNINFLESLRPYHHIKHVI